MTKNKLFKRDQKFGKWTLETYLGGGGNGEVWKCTDGNNNEAAIKLLKSVKPKPYSRFLDETTIIERNSDIAGIVPIIDKYLPEKLDGSIPFYVMPVAGSAEALLKDKSIETKVDAILQVCETLLELHRRGISHRDIKPANMLVYKDRYSLCDFGLVDYPDKKDVSLKNEEIGAKWTIAPEMRRESSKAKGIRADIYSLAKTLWILLTGNSKGFDGQYSAVPGLEFGKLYRECYTAPIDRLLASSTNNNPASRPNISEFISVLEEWKELNKNFHARNLEQWFEIQKSLFPAAFPSRVIWEDVNDIISILKVLCSYDNLNHMFMPSGGGLDLEDARLSHEQGCIELDYVFIEIVKPKMLVFESFGFDPEWNYFRLELDQLEPSGIYESDEGEPPYEYPLDEEELTELRPGEYDEYKLLEDRTYYEELGYDIPETARRVTRRFKGSYVIFNKRSPYNLTTSTYDARHNKMTTDEFRDYIKRQANLIKEKYGSRRASKPISDRMSMED